MNCKSFQILFLAAFVCGSSVQATKTCSGGNVARYRYEMSCSNGGSHGADCSVKPVLSCVSSSSVMDHHKSHNFDQDLVISDSYIADSSSNRNSNFQSTQDSTVWNDHSSSSGFDHSSSLWDRSSPSESLDHSSSVWDDSSNDDHHSSSLWDDSSMDDSIWSDSSLDKIDSTSFGSTVKSEYIANTQDKYYHQEVLKPTVAKVVNTNKYSSGY